MIKVDVRARRYGGMPVLGRVAFEIERGETVAHARAVWHRANRRCCG